MYSARKFVTDNWPEVVLEKFQIDVLDAISEPEAKVSVRSGKGPGKTALDAWIILWFECCFFPNKCAVTAPSGGQLEDALIPEVGLWLRRGPPWMSQKLVLIKDRLYHIENPGEAFASFRTARKDKPEALQGVHSDYVLVVIDEASGVDDIVFEVAEGTLSGKGTRILMTSNPTRLSGYFYDSHHKLRSHWKTFKVSAFDSSRVTKRFIEESKIRYGEESNYYRISVLGEFPLEDDDVAIPLALAEAAKYRDIEVIKQIQPVWGLDVARFGNCRTVLARRQANHYIGHKAWRKRDTMEVSGLVLNEYENASSDERPAKIYVDVIGVGAGVVDRLRELKLPVVGVNVGESPGQPRFRNLRSELWWRAREWLEARDSRLPDNIDGEELIGEICGARYKYTSTGKLMIESKEDMIKRNVESPDIGDAFMLTFAGTDRRRSRHDAYKRNERARGNIWAA